MAKVKYKNGNQTIILNNVKPDLLNFEDYVYVSVSIGTFSSEEYPSINGKQAGYVPKNTRLVVTAPATLLDTRNNINKYFYYMRTTHGEIFSYDRITDIYVNADISLECIYGTTEETEKQPIITFVGKGITIKPEENRFYLNWHSDIPSNYTKVNWGILLSSKADNESLQEEDMVVTNDYVTNKPQAKGGTQNFSYMDYFMQSTGTFNNCRLLKARAYCTIEKDGFQSVIYSRMITMQILK